MDMLVKIVPALRRFVKTAYSSTIVEAGKSKISFLVDDKFIYSLVQRLQINRRWQESLCHDRCRSGEGTGGYSMIGMMTLSTAWKLGNLSG